MITPMYDRLPDFEKEKVIENLNAISGKLRFQMSEVKELWRIWHQYRLGAAKDKSCARCYTEIVQRFIYWANAK